MVIIIGTDQRNVLNGMQKVFDREFEKYGNQKESDIHNMDYGIR
ncbi:conserved protein of unknown function [Candidatus Nitrosocosmicus franklandus]|uniref:Uncharacterized protein n=1 Tax=Candidatus Nitrosocosmicus franklandianus TaxID=1798806 RepID=A0A484I7N4_9ARCH|nr:conserved protein of unknown function [Candidatus Nitrosocosmicus franklandus]